MSDIVVSYPYNGYVFYPDKIGVRYIFHIHNHDENDLTSSPTTNIEVFFQISLVEDTQLPDQYLMHCEYQNKLVFIGFAEVPDKDIRLGLVQILSNKPYVILPCKYNKILNEWYITSLESCETVSSVEVARRVLTR